MYLEIKVCFFVIKFSSLRKYNGLAKVVINNSITLRSVYINVINTGLLE
jgi:hypothetical protein